MTSPPVASPEPDGAPRDASLDILRGLAILAILLLNVSDFGGAFAAATGNIRHLGWSAADRVLWVAREVFMAGTARGLLEMLFGAGMVILTDRAAARTNDARALGGYAWRNLILLAFGLAHVFLLLWPGDILHTYALAAMVAMLFRRASVPTLLLAGLFMASLQIVGGAPILAQEQARIERLERMETRGVDNAEVRKFVQARTARQQETAREIAAEDRQRTGSPVGWARVAWGQFLHWQRQGLELQWIWEAASTMLIGAALFRAAVLQGRRSARFYGAMLAAGYGIGLTLRAVGAAASVQPVPPPNILWIAEEAARLLVTLGHLAAVHLLLRWRAAAQLLAPFAAAGRVALSIYVAQTLICGWLVFPPWGMALYGRLHWAQLMGVAAAIDAVLLLAAVLYLRRWRIGPVEWAWRSLVERRILPWR